jgi:hypothetical protein
MKRTVWANVNGMAMGEGDGKAKKGSGGEG